MSDSVDGQTLRGLRLGAGISLEQLAAQAGVHASTVSRAERAEVIHAELADRLMLAFGELAQERAAQRRQLGAKLLTTALQLLMTSDQPSDVN